MGANVTEGLAACNFNFYFEENTQQFLLKSRHLSTRLQSTKPQETDISINNIDNQLDATITVY